MVDRDTGTDVVPDTRFPLEDAMKVNVDVYVKDIDAALAAVKVALEAGATDLTLRSSEDYDSGAFEHLNLMFEADHRSDAISYLDRGPFASDPDDL
jgi:hypothetical protein